MDLLLAYVWQNKLRVCFTFLVTVAEGIVSVLLLDVLNDKVLSPTSFSIESLMIFAALLLIFFAVSAGSQILLARIGHALVNQIRERVIKQIIDADYVRLQLQGKGRYIASLNFDINNFQRLFVELPYLIQGMIVTFSTLIYLAFLSPSLTGISVLWLLVALILTQIFIRRSVHHMRLYRTSKDNITADYHASIDGNRELKTNTLFAERWYRKIFQKHTRYALKQYNLSDSYYYLAAVFFDVLLLALIGFIFFINFEFNFSSTGTAITICLTLLYIRTFLSAVIRTLPLVDYALVSANKMSQLDLGNYEPQFKHQLSVKSNWQSVRWQNLNYVYPDARTLDEDEIEVASHYHMDDLFNEDEVEVTLPPSLASSSTIKPFTLSNINIELRRGSITMLVGKNGAGKSSLVGIMSGITPWTSGEMYIDQHRITKNTIAAYRHMVANIFSDFYLFNEIGVEQTYTTMQLMQTWLKRLQLQDKVSVDNFEFSTTNLSTGQRRRLALLIAIVSQRPIIILDEWAAEQDPSFKRIFYREILPLLKSQGKTIFVVSHDAEYFDAADYLYLIAQGQVSELVGEDKVYLAIEAVSSSQ
ncbi:ATP-binding cassette domain-containing protein [Psittacicella hinzii]|uniref:ATP-binding cassette transporter n=1 Tax=Psittacicella hinzii TaxID=2028575 RepID=A0A3A1YRZ1_9GAMM|nr:ATP-binding cassette domain-containing protein [Psittacicella hinzii]RIY39700.1 hypothetical protein CKF58_01765 [Psittacicella hinzii]